jgi:hypothetical protein
LVLNLAIRNDAGAWQKAMGVLADLIEERKRILKLLGRAS